jgi:hypothetical protein
MLGDTRNVVVGHSSELPSTTASSEYVCDGTAVGTLKEQSNSISGSRATSGREYLHFEISHIRNQSRSNNKRYLHSSHPKSRSGMLAVTL